jgi:hypothetical protein
MDMAIVFGIGLSQDLSDAIASNSNCFAQICTIFGKVRESTSVLALRWDGNSARIYLFILIERYFKCVAVLSRAGSGM